jgi:hypothetical protein
LHLDLDVDVPFGVCDLFQEEVIGVLPDRRYVFPLGGIAGEDFLLERNLSDDATNSSNRDIRRPSDGFQDDFGFAVEVLFEGMNVYPLPHVLQ